MKVEQTIQRVSKALEATDVVGATCKYASAVAEFELLFYEIGAISNLLKYLTTNQSMRHTECHLQHALYTSRRLTVNQNVEKLLNFVQARQNPYSLAADISVPLHNIFTKLAVDREVAARLLKCIENGDRVYSAYRQERFVNKTTKISSNISKRNLPEFAHHPQKTPH